MATVKVETYRLQSCHGLYLSAHNAKSGQPWFVNHLVQNVFSQGWEEFTFHPAGLGPNKFFIQTFHGTWLTARDDGKIGQADGPEGARAVFEVMEHGPGRVSLGTGRGTFVRAGHALWHLGCVDQAGCADAWEVFTAHLVGTSQLPSIAHDGEAARACTHAHAEAYAGKYTGAVTFDPRNDGHLLAAQITVGVFGCLVAVALLVPLCLGFGPAGIAAGSAAAAMQASIGCVAAGSAFAVFQSLGATGVLTSASVVVAGATAAAVHLIDNVRRRAGGTDEGSKRAAVWASSA